MICLFYFRKYVLSMLGFIKYALIIMKENNELERKILGKHCKKKDSWVMIDEGALCLKTLVLCHNECMLGQSDKHKLHFCRK